MLEREQLGDTMGVKITVASGYGLDLGRLDFSNLAYADETTESSKLFRAFYYSDGYADEFRGSGFKYDSDGIPTGGTVKSYAMFDGSSRLFILDGAAVKVTDIVDAALTFSTSDDMKVIANAMKGNDTVQGGNLRDVVRGYSGNDYLDGNRGNDVLRGGSGNDRIEGGLGRDYLYGESGSDTFIFRSVKDSTVAIAGRDTIFDFTKQDHIDLHYMDANSTRSGNQEFDFIGTKAFSGDAGELRFEKKASDTYIYGDLNGDRKADFMIHLDDAVTLKEDMFIL